MIEVSVILALSRSHQVTIRKEKWFKGRLARQVVIAARHDSRHVPTRAFAQRSTSTSWFTWLISYKSHTFIPSHTKPSIPRNRAHRHLDQDFDLMGARTV